VDATGLIFAGLDCDADAIEEWNRWYDLEHVPPNVSMPGVMVGRRYVAPPELHACRLVDDASGFAAGRGTFLTLYTLCGDPADAFADMTALRDTLYAGDRMRFPADKKAVREGDVLRLEWSVADPSRSLVAADVPFVGHTALVVVQRRSSEAASGWYRTEWAPAAVRLDGVHGVMSLTSATREGLCVDLVFLEGDAAALAVTLREEVPQHADTTVVLDAPFLHIDPLRYPWADAIRASTLPATVA
jgi:hypothetical protein